MYLSAERVAIVNRTIQDVFAQTCVAWQSIPHWDTGDPGQTQVHNDNPGTPFVAIQAPAIPVNVSVAELISSVPDELLNKITRAVVILAANVDAYVFPRLRTVAPAVVPLPALTALDILDGLIDARTHVEDSGFRAPNSLFALKSMVKEVHKLVGNASVKEAILDAGNINSLHRVGTLGPPVLGGKTVQAVMLGRRQRIASGYATDSSPGEEPVDLAVSIPPSFEIVGETSLSNIIKINVRIRYAVRPKTPGGLVVITSP
jgi:hypothetical protein